MSVAEFSIKNRLISFIVIIVVLAGGWIAYGNMPRFEDPEFTIREAIVITQYPGASPEEVANEVTEPLETAIQQMPEVEEVSSVSLDGVSQITVEVKYGDSQSRDALQLVWTKLRNRVRDAQGSLPPGTLESIVNDDFGDVYGIYYLITGEGYSPREIYEYARDLRTELLTVDGVARVTIQGGSMRRSMWRFRVIGHRRSARRSTRSITISRSKTRSFRQATCESGTGAC